MIQKFEINLKNMVYDYPTKSEHGFTQSEINSLLSWFPTINMEKFDNAMMGNTCMIEQLQFGINCISDFVIHYHCDVYKALLCGLENRDLKVGEID